MAKPPPEILLDVALRMSAAADLSAVLTVALEGLCKLVSAEHGRAVLVSGAGRIETTIAARPPSPEAEPPSATLSGLAHRVVHERMVTIVDEEVTGGGDRRRAVGVPVAARDAAEAVLDDATDTGSLELLPFDAAHVVAVLLAEAPGIEDLDAVRPWLERLARLVAAAAAGHAQIEAQRFRARVLGDMVHALRSPLQAALANSEFLRDLPDLDEEPLEISWELHAVHTNLARLINQSMRLSAIDRGTDAFMLTDIELESDLLARLAEYRSWLRVVGVRVDVDVEHGMPPLRTVATRFWVALEGAVARAISGAPSGSSVTVGVHRRFDRGQSDAGARPSPERPSVLSRHRPLQAMPGTEFVQFTVHHQGHPVDDDTLAQLFDPSESEGLRRALVTSSGLGMPLVADFVEHLGGAIWARSSDSGHRLTFTLPLEVQPLD